MPKCWVICLYRTSNALAARFVKRPIDSERPRKFTMVFLITVLCISFQETGAMNGIKS